MKHPFSAESERQWVFLHHLIDLGRNFILAKDRQGRRFCSWRHLLAITTLTMAYFAAGWLGTRLSYSPDSITLIWPPAGIALAAGVLSGASLWPGVVLGEMLVLLANHLPAAVSGSVAVGNAVAMLAGRWLLEKAQFDPHLERVRDVMALAALGGVMATLVSASVGVTAMTLGGVVAAGSVAVSTGFKWWLGDALGVLLITPVLLTCSAPPKAERPSPRRLSSMTAFLALALTGGMSFGDWLGVGSLQLTLTFLPFSCLVWIALHRGVRGSALAVFLITMMAVSGTASGCGPFIRSNVNDSLALLWGFLTTTGLTALLLSATLAERHRVEAALRASGQEFRTLFELSTVGLAEADPTSGRFIRTNQTFRQITGYLAEELLCKRFVELTHPDDGEQDPENVFQALERGGTGGAIEKRYRHQTGRVVWAQVSGTLLRDPIGRPYRMLVSLLDITERKRAEKALQEAARRKDEFLAMLAHELRNPLAPIRSAVAILNRLGPVKPRQQWAYDIIERQVTHLTRLVDDLLDSARLIRGQLRLQQEPVELATIVHQAVEAAQPLLDARQHHFHLTLPTAPVWLDADPVRLVQVLLNLLDNAAKYTEPGGRIELEADVRGAEIAVRVRDTGPGLSPALLARVFELFAQGERTLDRAQGGLGIGLTLVRRLVELHGGRVEAHSAGPGCGAEFTVWLPVLNRGDAMATATVSPPLARPIPNQRVLLVDDNPEVVESLALWLQIEGFEVRAATTGQAALELARQFHPQVMLLDLGMPGLNGYDVARRLQAWPPDQHPPRLIALTGDSDEETRRRVQEAGFTQQLIKPVEPDVLLTLLRTDV